MVVRMLLLWLRWLYTMVIRTAFYLFWALFPPAKPMPPITDSALLQSSHTLALWIRQRKRTSESIVSAFVSRSKAVNSILNAVVDEHYDEALQEAREVDQKLDLYSEEERANLEYSQPLLGVPFTVKEIIAVKGMSHTGGLLSRRGIKATYDAELVKMLREAGGIPLAVTNIPELSLWWESYNLLFGRTNNPYSASRTPGGSSGGEAALLSSCGTPVSIGTDLGGSIRFPSFCCGVFGHKPSCDWVSKKNMHIYPEKLLNSRASVAGPLARHSRDLAFIMEIIAPVHARGLSAKVEATSLSSLKIWWAEDVGSPLISPTTSELRNILHKAVHHLHATYSIPTAKYEANLLKEWLLWACGQRRHTFPILLFATFQKFTPENPSDVTSPYYWKTVQKSFMDILGSDGVLIMPTAPELYYHGQSCVTIYDACIASLFNGIEFPATAVPLGLSNDGLPLGVQVVTTPGNDHLSLAVARALEEKFGGWVSPSPIKVASS
ncbi:fatty-acid amide hydrolase 2-like isoform X2 [Homarus americanus]|uniref:fatty-acid amide hydrolase 2-like isoform X2 n=1 Tax=Homarus americanus TaxID=6706 RepID=UPI001C46A379|nr:fatty-acid amide hydrolase 2-like isoform X2 [Homarus americanus]